MQHAECAHSLEAMSYPSHEGDSDKKVCIADDAPVADRATFVASGPILVYVNVDPTKQCADGRFCLSNDRISCATLAARVIRAVEIAEEIW
jgi:hypothetical protein